MNLARKLAAVAVFSLPLYGIVGVEVAHAATTYVVDDDGKASATNCNAPAVTPHTTIQGGVAAASAGDTVKVCPGTYDEHVTIDKQLTVRGAKAGLDARNRLGSLSESVVDPEGDSSTPTFSITASGVTLDGFYLAGNSFGPAVQTAATESGYSILNNRFISNAFGLYFGASGSSTSTVSKNVFSANNENLANAAAAGNGIYSDQGLANAMIDSNKFRSNINAAILVAAAGSDITASDNSSQGDGSFFIAFDGSDYSVTSNVVADSLGSGIFFNGGSDILIQRNRVSGSAFSGIRISTGVSSANVASNTATGSGDQGISVSTEVSGGVTVVSNTTTANNGDGILFSEDTSGNVIRSNTSRSNGNYDCQDESTGDGTAGIGNTWTLNKGTTSDPVGLCTPRGR